MYITWVTNITHLLCTYQIYGHTLKNHIITFSTHTIDQSFLSFFQTVSCYIHNKLHLSWASLKRNVPHTDLPVITTKHNFVISITTLSTYSWKYQHDIMIQKKQTLCTYHSIIGKKMHLIPKYIPDILISYTHNKAIYQWNANPKFAEDHLRHTNTGKTWGNYQLLVRYHISIQLHEICRPHTSLSLCF